MSPAAAAPSLFAATAAPIARSTATSAAVVLRAEVAAAAQQELLALLRARGATLGDGTRPPASLTQALGEAVERHLAEHDPTGDSDHVSMVKVRQLVARVCEYAGTLMETCLGTAKATKREPCAQEDEDRDLASRVASVHEDRDVDSTVQVCEPGSPVKCEEIRPAEELEVRPYDQAFRLFQANLRALDDQRLALRERMDARVAELAATREMLYKLEDRMLHRMDRARARNILFVVKLEEVWLQDPASVAVMTQPCADCATSRNARPRLKHPSPAKSTTTTPTASSASTK